MQLRRKPTREIGATAAMPWREMRRRLLNSKRHARQIGFDNLDIMVAHGDKPPPAIIHRELPRHFGWLADNLGLRRRLGRGVVDVAAEKHGLHRGIKPHIDQLGKPPLLRLFLETDYRVPAGFPRRKYGS